MEKFYTVIRMSPMGVEKMWHYKSEENARAKFEKEVEKMKTIFAYNDQDKDERDVDWVFSKNLVSYLSETGRDVVELFTCSFKD